MGKYALTRSDGTAATGDTDAINDADCYSDEWSKKEMNLAIVTALLFALSTPATVSMKVHEKQQLQVTGRASGQTVAWMSSNPRVASVINSASPKLDGTVIAHEPGTVTITATVGTDKTQTQVTVVKP